MELRRLAIALIFISLASSLVGASNQKPLNNMPEQHENWMLEEPKSDCPEFCTCVRKTNDGLIAKCVQLTASQHFKDKYSDFKLLNDSKNTKEAITLYDRVFIHLHLKSVQSITIVDIKIASIDKNAFEELHNLVLVNLTNNSVEQIHPDTFSSNKNMRQLSLSGNPLAVEGMMNNSISIPSLQELDLSLCQLNTLTNTFFRKLTQLAYLSLASNNLDVIDSDTFRNLTSLEDLDLSNNNIHSLNGDLFMYNQALAQLTLKNNPLVTMEDILLPGVTYLDLSFCKFTQISENSFNGVLGTTNLNLSHNVIAEITVSAFAKMPKLAYLDLSDNFLDSQLDGSLFVKNSQLETLSLKNNPNIKFLPEDGFKGNFDEFFKLNVANCGIGQLSSGLLKNLKNLSQLDISRNFLTTFRGDSILQPNVKHVNLAFNRITDTNDIQFPARSRIQKLSLAGNKVKHLQTHFFDNLQFLTSLDLSDCGMDHIWQNKRNEILSLPKVNTINLSGNNLEKITRQDLEVFSNLDMLNLNSNPLVCDSDLKDLANYLSEARVGSFSTRHASEATSDNMSWPDFLRALGCLPNAQTVKSTRLSINNGNESSEDDKRSHFFEHFDKEYKDKEENGRDREGEEEEEEDGEEEDKNEQVGKKNEAHNQYGETPAKQHLWGSSVQIIVMLVAAVTTFVVIVALVVLIILCRSQMLLHRETVAKRRGHRLNIYKPLYNNEHLNSPTTPIMKTRDIEGSCTREVSTVSV